MNENLRKKKISKNSESCENNLNSALIFFLEIIHHKNFFCKLLLRKTFYKLVLWIIFFKCCKLSSDIFWNVRCGSFISNFAICRSNCRFSGYFFL